MFHKTSKIPNEYWLKWKEKFFSLFVSGKMLVFYSMFYVSTYLLMNDHITEDIWLKVLLSGVGVMTLRGVVEFAEIKYNHKSTIINDKGEYNDNRRGSNNN